jgi:hypothetical protein
LVSGDAAARATSLVAVNSSDPRVPVLNGQKVQLGDQRPHDTLCVFALESAKVGGGMVFAFPARRRRQTSRP